MGKTVIIVVIIIILLAGGVYFLMVSGKIPNPLSKKTANTSLGGQIYEQVQNPIQDKIPETNPFAKLNPFKGVYKNPFE